MGYISELLEQFEDDKEKQYQHLTDTLASLEQKRMAMEKGHKASNGLVDAELRADAKYREALSQESKAFKALQAFSNANRDWVKKRSLAKRATWLDKGKALKASRKDEDQSAFKVGDMVKVTDKWKKKNEPKMSDSACRGKITHIYSSGLIEFKNSLGGSFPRMKPEDLELLK